MSRCNCLTFAESTPVAGVRYLGATGSSVFPFQVAIPICRKTKVCFFTATVSGLPPTVPLPTVRFTLMKTIRSKCGGIVGPFRTDLTVVVTGNGTATFCVPDPVIFCPGENATVLVEPSDSTDPFIASAQAC